MATIRAKKTLRDKEIISLDDTPETGLGTSAPIGSVALINKLGVASMYQKTGAGNNAWTAIGSSNPVEVDLAGGTVIDWSAGASFRKNINANTTFTFTNSANAKSIKLTVSNSSVATPVTISFSGVTINSNFNSLIYPLSSMFIEITEVNGVYYIRQENYKPIDTDLVTNGGFIVGEYGDTWHYSSNANKTFSVAGFANGRITKVFVENTGGSPITIGFTGLGLTTFNVAGTVLTLNAGDRYLYDLSCFVSTTVGALTVFIRSLKLN